MPNVFFSYSHLDEGLRDQLEKQLSMLKRQGVIETWHDRRIGAGEDFSQAIDERINSDEIILLLVSADFIASDYCYEIEMRRAMERQEKGEAVVIPVILRACDWRHAPFGKLKAVPLDGKPITQWADIDEAFLQVAMAVRETAGRLEKPVKAPSSIASQNPVSSGLAVQTTGPRSSNLRLAKSFTQKDKDDFKHSTFEYIARFFENSLGELGERNSNFDGVYKRVDANRFFATIYRDGKDVARGTIYTGGEAWGGSINYVQGETSSSNTMNESLRVDADEHTLFMSSLGMASYGRDLGQKLTQEGAAELLWKILIGPLQSSSH